MRPKRTILLFDPDEGSRSRNRFLLISRGYRVLSAHVLQDALDILAAALPGEIDLLWANVSGDLLPFSYFLVRSVKGLNPRLKVLLTVTSHVSDGDAVASAADALLHGDTLKPAIVLLKIHTLTTRKRGPKPRFPAPAAAAENRCAV